jgi:hypothetical protein
MRRITKRLSGAGVYDIAGMGPAIQWRVMAVDWVDLSTAIQRQ